MEEGDSGEPPKEKKKLYFKKRNAKFSVNNNKTESNMKNSTMVQRHKECVITMAADIDPTSANYPPCKLNKIKGSYMKEDIAQN